MAGTKSKAKGKARVASHVGYAICKAQGLFAGARALAEEAQSSDDKEILSQIQHCIDAGNAQLDELLRSLEATNG
jgi:hypothetical protein